ncbi:MAG: phosphotransferase [Holosporales bacterium]|nr:phosphotransferase [Holosporales bacterium]
MNHKLLCLLCVLLPIFCISNARAIKDSDIANVLHVHNIQFAQDKYKLNTSKRVHEIRANEKRYIVMEFKNKDSDTYRLVEIERAKMLSASGCGPTFLGKPANNEFYIVEFIDTPLKYDNLNDQKLRELGKFTRKVHNHKYTKNGKSQLDRIKKHSKKIQKRGIAVPDGFNEAVDSFIKNSEKLDTKIGFCHGDLNPSNIRMRGDGSIVFIDWNNAGNGNVYEELGYLVQTYGLDERQISVLLEGYLGESPTQDYIDRVKFFAKRTCLLTAAVWFGFSESSYDKKISQKDRVKIINDMAKSEGFMKFEEYSRKGQIPNVKSANKDEVKKYALSAWKEYKENIVGANFFDKLKKWFGSFL